MTPVNDRRTSAANRRGIFSRNCASRSRNARPEFAAGSAGANSGLAFRLLEAQFRLNIPRLFAALVLLSFTGVMIFAATSLVSYVLLRRWHESALRREN